jgi:hypothetical protein
MMNGVLGFLARSYYLAPPPPPLPVSKLTFFLSLPVCRRSSLLTGEGGGSRGGAKSDDVEKAWSSINHSILSGSIPWRWSHFCLNSSIACF